MKVLVLLRALRDLAELEELRGSRVVRVGHRRVADFERAIGRQAPIALAEVRAGVGTRVNVDVLRLAPQSIRRVDLGLDQSDGGGTVVFLGQDEIVDGRCLRVTAVDPPRIG